MCIFFINAYNTGRSKVVKCTSIMDNRSMDVTLNGKLLEEVEYLKYLGSFVAVHRGTNEAVKLRMKGVRRKGECRMDRMDKYRSLTMIERKSYMGIVALTDSMGLNFEHGSSREEEVQHEGSASELRELKPFPDRHNLLSHLTLEMCSRAVPSLKISVFLTGISISNQFRLPKPRKKTLSPSTET